MMSVARPVVLLSLEKKGDRPLPGVPAPGQRDHGCWPQLRNAPWSRLAFGDTPELFALALVFAFALLPLFEGLGLAIMLFALLGAFLARTWLWCRSTSVEAAPEANEAKADSQPEEKSGKRP